MRALHLLRHGCTEMNEYLAQHPWDAPGFQDPLMYDTRLTAGGLAQARRARERVQGLTQCPFPPGVIVVSPLTRALRTMEEAFADVLATGDVPVVVTPLASERVYHGSDVGALRSELEAEFPQYDFSELPAGPWWYGGGAGGGGGGAGAPAGRVGHLRGAERRLRGRQGLPGVRQRPRVRPDERVALVLRPQVARRGAPGGGAAGAGAPSREWRSSRPVRALRRAQRTRVRPGRRLPSVRARPLLRPLRRVALAV